MENPALIDAHTIDSDLVLAKLHSTAQGLSQTEALGRLQQVGPNALPAAPGVSAWVRLLRQFHNVLIYVLLASAALSAALGHWVDGAVIMAVVVINALIGFVQEGRAERSLRAIASMIAPRATLRREGRRGSFPADEVVPGDVLLLEPGDRVAADVRLFAARNLAIDEAALTGESLPVLKAVEAVGAQAVLAERASMAYAGTLVSAGQGAGVVVATGLATELGRISAMMRETPAQETPLLREMARFGRRITLFTLITALVSFAVARWLRDYPLADALMAVVGLAVAAIPEGLPAVLTITLAIGVQRMARRNAIIRRLPAVETLGAVSVICSDKTGTLTRNEMMAACLITPQGRYTVSGAAYAPHGEISFQARPLASGEREDVIELARAALLCNDAVLIEREGLWRVEGDPMEGALIALAMKAGLEGVGLRKQFPRTDEIPFDAGHRFMASLHHSHTDGAFIVVKGAPEPVAAMCASATQPLDAAQSLAAEGMRVLAFAAKRVASDKRDLSFEDLREGFAWLGCVGFIDPPRDEALDAVARCHEAGVRVVMITGDHALTALHIARELGLSAEPRVLSGEALAAIDDEALKQVAAEVDVFARAAPGDKLRLVRALQARGQIVAMTGDGVNDAPAIKCADIGVAMGGKGVEAAREAAAMVLADDNFASIVAAVREGRTVYDNLLKVIAWSIPTNFAEGLIIAVAIVWGLPLPITPIQILWVNTVTAVLLGLTLAFEPGEPGAMKRPPRAAHEGLLSAAMLWRMGGVAAVFLVAVFAVFFWTRTQDMPIESARTLVVNALVAMEVFYLFSVRAGGAPVSGVMWGGVGLTVGVQGAFTHLPWMQGVFGTQGLSWVEWVGVLVVGAVVGGVLHRARG